MLRILTVAGLASFEIYAAIPAGFAFGLSPWTIAFASIAGGLAGVFAAAFLGDKIRQIFARQKKKRKQNLKPVLSIASGTNMALLVWGFLEP